MTVDVVKSHQATCPKVRFVFKSRSPKIRNN